MPWIIIFVITWILFFLLVDKTTIRKTILGGLLTLLLGTIVDWGGQKLELYAFYDLIIPWFGCSFFYKFGPIFTMGILFSQSIPKSNKLQALNIFVFAIFYITLEYLIILTGVAQYLHWNTLASFFVNLLVFSALTWFTNEFLKKS